MGPATSIIVRDKFTEISRISIESEIEALSNAKNGEDFWVGDRPFIFSFGWEYESEAEEYVGLSRELGWAPKDQLIFAAMCNQKEDHRYLGELCAKFSEILDGYTAFGLSLRNYTNDEEVLNHKEHISDSEQSFLGPALMKLWSKHADFGMVK